MIEAQEPMAEPTGMDMGDMNMDGMGMEGMQIPEKMQMDSMDMGKGKGVRREE